MEAKKVINKKDKVFGLIYKNISSYSEPFFIGFIGGLSYKLFEFYTMNFIYVAGLIAFVLTVIKHFINKKYPDKCACCGAYKKGKKPKE